MNKNRKISYKLYAAALIIGTITLLCLINLFVSLMDTKYNLTLDMTSYRIYSLTNTTKGIINSLDEDVFIYTTQTAGIEDSNVEELLKNYAAESDKIHVINIDILKTPSLVEHYNKSLDSQVTAGSIIVSNAYDTNEASQSYKVISYSEMYEYDEESETYKDFAAEDAITGAIKYVAEPNNQKIWILDNHIADMEAIESIKIIVSDENFQVEMLNLLNGQNPMLPEDILIIISMESDLTPVERDSIAEFLDEGGKLMLGIDAIENSSDFMPNAASLAERYNIKMGTGTIQETDLDNIAVTGEKDYRNSFILAQMAEHQITNEFILGDYKVLLGIHAGSLILPEKVNNTDISITPLLFTSETSYIQTEGKENKSMEYGEFCVLTLVEDAKSDSKIIITASPEIFTYSDVYSQDVYKNKDFLIKCIYYLADKEQDVQIFSKQIESESLMISTMKQAYIIIGIVCAVIPLIIFGAGILVYIKRKNL